MDIKFENRLYSVKENSKKSYGLPSHNHDCANCYFIGDPVCYN